MNSTKKQGQYILDKQYQMQDKYHKAISLINRQVSLQAFQKFILNSGENKHLLFKAIREVETAGFPRFNVWRLLLDVLPISGNWQDKKIALESSRKRWSDVKEQSKTGVKGPIAKQSPMPKNPLMKNMFKNEKKEVDSDPFLNEQIKKDVDRTYQEMEFFQDSNILKLLTSVLFVWCKLNPDTSYKQGMNELLASIVYVYFQEAIPADFQPSNETEEKFFILNSLAHAEADIFAIFERVMAIQKDMYKQSLDGKIKGNVNPNSKNNSPILQRIIQIQDHKLKSLDLQLFRILKLQDVKTKTFLLRWIRCIHTREFGLFNSLPIWDSILLDAYESPNSKRRNEYEFIDAMCLAMFIYMRSLVFTRETANEILQIYQKYPQLEGNDLKELINLAWSVCEELRTLSNSQNNSSNWYQDSGKSKLIGLMDKGRQTEYMSKQPQKPKYDDFEREANIYPDLDEKVEEKERSPQIKRQIVQVQKIQKDASPKPHQNNFQKSNERPAQPPKIQPQSFKPKRQITFEQTQVKSLIDNLKKSIALNDDIQSRSLANQVLKILQDRLKK